MSENLAVKFPSDSGAMSLPPLLPFLSLPPFSPPLSPPTQGKCTFWCIFFALLAMYGPFVAKLKFRETTACGSQSLH